MKSFAYEFIYMTENKEKENLDRIKKKIYYSKP